MYLTPLVAKSSQAGVEPARNFVQLSLGKRMILSQFGWSIRAMQVKHCLASVPDNMNVGWAMIVWINRYTQSGNCQYSGHYSKNPSELGYFYLS